MLRILSFFLILLLSASLSAQETTCAPDLNSVAEKIDDAKTALDKNDLDSALKLIAEARNNLELIEAQCANFAPETAGDSRTNPVTFGESQRIEIFDEFVGLVQVINYIDNANDLVLEKDDFFNDPPDEGMRYIVIEYKVSCEKPASESCEVNKWDFDIVGNLGIVYESDNANDSGFSENVEIFGGAEIIMSRPYQVGADETDFVLFNEYGDRVFFATH